MDKKTVFNSIIFDKSTFESLNKDEIIFLQKYYFPIIPHILIIEILSDLKKSRDEKLSKVKVQQLSYKILQMQPIYTMNYREVINLELSGNNVQTDRRPIVNQGKRVINKNGQRGFIIDEMLEEQVLRRWQANAFDIAEKIFAEKWRESIEENKIKLNNFHRSKKFDELKTLEEVIAYINDYLKTPELQKEILIDLLSTYKINQTVATQLFYKFETKEFTLLQDYAPYTIFCYKLFLVFHLASLRGIYTQRKTDYIDLQYLYYLPFTSIFTSNDKFHKKFTPYFLDKDQTFIIGNDLKEDLEKFVILRNKQDEDKLIEWTKQYNQYPPSIENSFTTALWNKNVPLEIRSNKNGFKNRTEKENAELVDKLKNMINSPIDKIPNLNEPDFIAIKRKMYPYDYCPCGSGKLFKDCHWDKVKNNN